MIDYILNVIIRKFIIMMDNINTVINFIIILASFIMVIKVFLDLSHIQKAFLDFRLTFTRLIKVYWLTRSNRQKYIRLYIELFIIRSGAKKVTKQMFKTISDEFISLRDRDNPEIEVADCSFLITERFNESVKQYFDYFSKPNNMSTFMIPEDKPVSFISNITIKEGFLSPYVLIDGLITRYADDWPGILDKYKLFFNDSGDVDSQDLSSLFCWLLWGPSWQPVFNKKSYAIFNYSFGDENNAIPVILPAHQNSFAQHWIANDSWGENCEIQLKIFSSNSYIEKYNDLFTLEYQYALEQYRNKGDDFACIMEYRSHKPKYLLGDAKYYCTAYIWIMLERITEIFDPFSIEKCIIMFEHANLADNGHRSFLMETLISKTCAYLVKKHENMVKNNAEYKYRFCIASSNDAEIAFRKKVYEMSQNDEYKYFNDFIITKSIRTPVGILKDIDYVFNHTDDETVSLIDIKDDYAGMTDLCSFYGNIFFQAFPDPDERESLEFLIDYIRESAEGEDRHILILKQNTVILGGMVFNYFHKANSGYISYIAVDENQRRKGYAKMIFEGGMCLMEQDAKRIKNKSIDYVYLEIDKYEGEIPQNVKMWDKFGFKRVNMKYIQPPLSVTKNATENLMLGVRTFNTVENYIPPGNVKCFLTDFFTRSFSIPDDIIDKYVKETEKRLDEKDASKLFDLIDKTASQPNT